MRSSLLRKDPVNQLITCPRWHRHLQTRELLHQVLRVDVCVFASSPASPTHSVRNVPQHKITQFLSFSLGASQHNSEASVENFSPSCAAPIVQSNPSGPSEGSAHKVLNRHVSTNHAAVSNRRSLAVRTVSSRNIMVVPGQSNRS